MAEIAAGLAVGVSETLVGYPFLTLKTMVQNKVPLRGLTLPRLYQGARYPFVSSIGFNALVFPLAHRLHHQHDLPYVYCGALAGLAVAPQCWFLDTFTIRRQTNQRVHRHMFRGARGFGMTAVRDPARRRLLRHLPLRARVLLGTCRRRRGGVRELGAGALWTRCAADRSKCDLRAASPRSPAGLHFALIRATVVNAVSFPCSNRAPHVHNPARWCEATRRQRAAPCSRNDACAAPTSKQLETGFVGRLSAQS